MISLPLPASPDSTDAGSPAPGFDISRELQGIQFRVTTPNNSSINEVTIQPTGLERDNKAQVVSADGSVTGVEVADLDGNGSPEIYVYVSSAGSGSYGSLIAFAANQRKSLSAIYLPPLEDDPQASEGYMGHDQFAVVENTLQRRFPLYRAGDTNAAPSGGTRQVQYSLHAGEAGWILKRDKFIDY
jgi:hypothetical protein